jgi:4'-phosphopantetheinyl transferase EntD
MAETSVRPRLKRLLHQPGLAISESSLPPSDAGPALHPEEARMLEGCVEKRQREILAGRRCARLALAQLGIVDVPLLAGPDRAPLWPAAVVGSLTHTDGCAGGYCGVVVGESRRFTGIGIDAEPRLPLPGELWDLILDPEEKRQALQSTSPGVHARLVYPTVGRVLEFSEVHVEVQPEEGLFLAQVLGSCPALQENAKLVGRVGVDDELIVTTLVLAQKERG